jgi:hypothetical protein
MLIERRNNMKRIVCENKYGDELFSFDFEEDISIKKYHNCEIADVEKDGDVTIIRLQEF